MPGIPLEPAPLKVNELELELELELDDAKLDEEDLEKLPEYPAPLGILKEIGCATPKAPDPALASAKKEYFIKLLLVHKNLLVGK